MATATQIAPFLAEKILPVLQKSARAAVTQCTGGDNKRACGFLWASGEFGGAVGVGQTMNVLAAVSSLLIGHSGSPATAADGGTSIGDPNAGVGSGSIGDDLAPITTTDRVGAGVLTAVIVLMTGATFGWMMTGK